MREFKVSIIIACYNSESFIRDTLDSILSQTYKNWECLCVDDSSTDNTMAILQEYAALDNRIRIFKKANGGNVSKSVNYVLNEVQGEFMILCGHDDRYSPDLLENAVIRQNETNADVIIPDACIFHPDKPHKNFYMVGTKKYKNNTNKNKSRSIILSNYEAVARSIDWQISVLGLYRANIIKQYGFCETGMNTDEFSERVFLYNANKVAFSRGVYYYYQLPTSMTKAIAVRRFDIFKCDELLYKFLEENNFEKKYLKKCLGLTVKKYFALKKMYLKNYKCFTKENIDLIESYFREGYKNIVSHLQYKWLFILKNKIINRLYTQK